MRPSIRGMLLVAGLLGASSLPSQAGEAVSAAIPFSFTAGDKEFPTGTYSFELKGGQLSIQGRKARAIVRAMDLKFMGDVYKETHRYEILFNRYGDTYFLAEVWVKHFGMEPLKSAAEKAREEAGDTASPVKLRVKPN